LGRVTVRPQAFTMVAFDAGRIAALAAEVADTIGLPGDVEVAIEVDETSPLGHTSTVITGQRVEILAESGAFEDPKRIRQLSEPGTRVTLARLLYRARDRLDPGFGRPPADPELTLEQHAAWDVYAVGRYIRLSGDGAGTHQQSRRRYHFRIRHGFSDAADRVFDRLWGADGLTWPDLEAACAETRAARLSEDRGR
jgi:hypothetical protein